MKVERVSEWLLVMRPPGPARMQLFCFPHAGSGASAYRGWGRYLGPDIELCIVQLPGREDRLHEEPFTDLQALVRAASAALAPMLKPPFAFFGHSMGALVAFEFAQALHSDRKPLPRHVIVSGRRAPHLPARREPLHALPPGEFERALFDLAGTPQEVLADAELMALLAPVLRADLKVCETYEHRRAEPFDIPLSVFGGTDDPEAPTEDLEAWALHTRTFAGIRLFPGNHFYMRERAPDVVAAIAATLMTDGRPNESQTLR